MSAEFFVASDGCDLVPGTKLARRQPIISTATPLCTLTMAELPLSTRRVCLDKRDQHCYRAAFIAIYLLPNAG
jgi:hypothetical protein